MILTEEQRGALKRVVAYMDEMYSVASPYHGCTEDANLLRAMIDSSGTVEPTGGFDLERARGLRDFLQDDCAEVGDVWGEMIAEIERLRGYEIAARDLSADLTKVAIERDGQAARIEELEADNQNLVTLNKSLMNNDWILRDNNRKYRKRAQKAELQNKELNSKIGPDADAKPREGLYGKYRIAKVGGSPVDPNADYFVLRLDSDPVARRAALQYSYMTPDRTLAIGLQEKLTKYNPKMEDCINLQFFGMEKPRIWRITEERKAALAAMSNLSETISCPDCGVWIGFADIGPHIAVLRGMLEESQ